MIQQTKPLDNLCRSFPETAKEIDSAIPGKVCSQHLIRSSSLNHFVLVRE